MTNAPARDVFCSFGTLRTALMAAASGGLLALAPSASAGPVCTGDGNANTCIIGINGGEANIATESVDAQLGTDTLQFNSGNLTLDTTALGTAIAGSVRFANFEVAHVMSGATLTATGLATASTQSLIWTVDAGGSLIALGGNGIGNGSVVTVNGTFTVGGDANDETIGDLAGGATGSVVLSTSGKSLIAGGASVDTTFAGVISGSGNFVKAGSEKLVLSGNNSYTGTTTVAAGVLEIQNAGAIDNSSSVSTSSIGWLRGTVAYNIGASVTNGGALEGSVTIAGDLANNGVLRPGVYIAPPSGSTVSPTSMGAIQVNGNYSTTGTVSVVDMQVDLDAALPANGTPGVTHDYLNILGNVTGTSATRVFLSEADAGADLGLPTTGNGIQLIRIVGTNAPGLFTQASSLSAGAYQYLLTYVPNYSGSDDGYFLKSAIRDELFAQPALLSAGQELIRSCFRDDQRVPDSPKGATYGRAWVGYHQGNTSFGANTGIDMSEDFNCTNGGMDWRMGYGWFGGVSGGFGKVNADLATPGGGGTLDGNARMIEAYASFTSSSLFVNLSAGYADMDWTYKGALTGALTTSSSGLIGSAQAGVALDVAPFAVKIFGSVDYDDTNCGTSCFGFAVNEDTGLLLAKGTVRFDGVSWGGSIRPWASVSYSDVLSNGINTVSVGAVSVSADTNSALLDIDAGLQAYLDENLALFADGGYRESLNKDITGYKAGIGLKLYW